jgi:Popeye protein conserved region
MDLLLFLKNNLIHLGAMLYLVCFLFRNQIGLRIFAIAGDLAYTGYYYTVAEKPLWDAMFWSSANIVINLLMISFVLRDQRMQNLSDDELKLYAKFNSLSPGEFRKLLTMGKWNKAENWTTLTVEGQSVSHLHYILEGNVDIDKSGRKIAVEPGLFIGEIAYLKQRPASATVKAAPGTLYMSWTHDALTTAKLKYEGLSAAIDRLINADLAEKVARA